MLGVQRDDLGENRSTAQLAVVVLGHNPRPDFDLLPRLQHTTKNTPTGDTALEVIDLGPRLVHIKRPDHNQPRRRGKVAERDRDLVDDVFTDDLHVILELCRDRDDRRTLGDGALDELEDGLVLFGRLGLLDEVDLVLEDDDVLKPERSNERSNPRTSVWDKQLPERRLGCARTGPDIDGTAA